MTSPPVFVPSWHSLAILLNFGPCSITAQPGFPRQCLVGRACVCQESGWKPGSGRWVRWTLVSWCHLNRALMTGPSCFGCAPQHLSDGGFGAHKCSAALGPCCSQSFYYSPVMKSNGADSTSSAEHGCVVPVCLRTSHRGHCCFLAQSTLPFFFPFLSLSESQVLAPADVSMRTSDDIISDTLTCWHYTEMESHSLDPIKQVQLVKNPIFSRRRCTKLSSVHTEHQSCGRSVQFQC